MTNDNQNKMEASESHGTNSPEVKKSQQITLPLDFVSKTIIQTDLPVFQSKASGTLTTNGYIIVKINGINYKLMTC